MVRHFMILAGFLALMLPCLPAHASSARLDRLGVVFSDFHQGFVYWARCSDLGQERALHPHYEDNWNLALIAYVLEAQNQHPNASENEVNDAVQRKSATLNNSFVSMFQNPAACHSADADRAKKIIALFDRQTPKGMQDMLNSIGR